MPIFSDEVFGPVVSVTPFDSADEGIELANATRYGLAAAVWTRDSARAAAARRIRAGTVWVNAYGSIRPEVQFGGFGVGLAASSERTASPPTRGQVGLPQ